MNKSSSVWKIAATYCLWQRNIILFALVLAIGLFLAGCSRETSQPFVSQQRLERGLVLVLPGIEGRSQFNEAIAAGLVGGGVGMAVEIHDWTSRYGPLYNLRSQDLHVSETARLTRRIELYHIQYPGRPVYLVGQSGGAAMAIWAAEQLGPSGKLDGLILIAATVEPTYSLQYALDGTRQGIVSFHSERDWVFLGLGTTVAGTMTGTHGSSAGRVGFVKPTGQTAACDKLFQIPWQPHMSQAGNMGLHVTSGARQFVVQYVAPLLCMQTWDYDVIRQLTMRPAG